MSDNKNFRIIRGSKDTPDVLLNITYNQDEGTEDVHISTKAWDEDGDEHCDFHELIVCHSIEVAQAVVAGLSAPQMAAWCEREGAHRRNPRHLTQPE